MADEPPTSETTAGNPAPTSQDLSADRSWERVWTLDEMRKGADHWTLAGDSGLLLYLQEFSQKMILRTHEIEKEVGNLVHESKLTGVRVNNAFNDFMMLANTQFVENRVYVDDEEIQEKSKTEETTPEEQEKTREQKEAELIPKVSEAIQLGVHVIEEAFEKLDTNVDNTDSEDDDESYRVDPILEAKDPYVDRLLPHLIGSPNFMNDDDVGLRDISDEESDAGSISESESEDEEAKEDKKSVSNYSYSDSMSDSDAETKKTKKKTFDSDEESDSEGDLFGEAKQQQRDSDSTDEEDIKDSDSEGGDDTQAQPIPPEPLDFASELARKLGGGAAPPKPPSPKLAGEDDDEAEDTPKHSDKHKKKKKKDKERKRNKSKSKEKDEDDLFKAEGENSDDDLFGGGLFAKKSGGLFDKEDDSDEGELFGEDTKKRTATVKTFDTDEEEEVVEKVKETKADKRGRTSSGKKIPAGGVSMFGAVEIKKSDGGGVGLFDEDDEDDLFSASKPKSNSHSEVVKQKPAPVSNSGGSGLFADDDEEDDLFSGKPTTTTSTTTSSKSAPKQESKKLSLFDDDDDDDDDFTSEPIRPQPKIIEEKKEPSKKKLPAGAVSMFGPGANPLAAALKKQRPQSSDDEDDWSDGGKSRSESIKSNQSTTSKSSVNSFTTKPKSNSFSRNAKASAGLFDEEDGDDLFSSSSKPITIKQPDKKKIQEEKPRSGSMFDDDADDDDLFGSKPADKPKQQTKKPPAGAVSMFPGGINPFGKKKEADPQTKTEEPIVEKKEEPAKKTSISLFGDDAQEGGLFGEDTKPAKQTTVKKPKSMFDEDDDDLFGSKSDDLFSKPQEPVTTKAREPPKQEQKKVDTTTSITKVTKPKATKPTGGMGLFGDEQEEEGDLFSKPANPPESAPIQEEEVPKPKEKKPPAFGVSMFGPGTAGLTSGLKKRQDKSEDTEEKHEEKSNQTKTPRKTTADPLFGDTEGDLFGSGPVQKQEVKTTENKEIPKSVKPTSLFTPPPLSNSPLDDSDEDDLFGSGKQRVDKKAPESKQESPTEVKPKKPVGGVSMFGGMSPFAGAVKKPSEVPPSSSPGISSPEEDLFSVEQKTKKDEPRDIKKPVTGKIGKLQANLNFNPVAMLPGAAPPMKEQEPISISFDAPPEIRTLQSANKDRAKIQTKRRPPSRVARKRASAISPDGSSDDFFTPTTPVDIDFDSSRMPPPLSGPPPRVPSPGLLSTSPRKSDMFGNEDLFGETSRSVIMPKSAPIDDIFSSDALSSLKDNKQSNNIDDMFAAPPPVSSAMSSEKKSGQLDDLFGAKTENKPLTKPFNDNDDDLFTSPSLSKAKTKDEKKKEPVTSGDGKAGSNPSVPLDNDDDLFSTPGLSKKKQDTKADQVDDLFGKSSLDKKKDETKKTDTKSNPVDNNDDDLFASTAKPDKKSKTKKATTKDEDLFADETDIFNDIPKAKPKEKKVKKKTATAPKKQIFKDDIDDIFADTSAPSKPKEKKKKNSEPNKAVSKDKGKSLDDIFDDPLS